MYVVVTSAFLIWGYKRSAELGHKQAKLHVLETEKMNIACNFRPTKISLPVISFLLLPHNVLLHSHLRHTYETQLLNRSTYQNTHVYFYRPF